MSHLNIDGAQGVRSVGWPLAPWLMRAASLDDVTPAGAAELNRLGVALVVDLREDEERAGAPLPLPVRHIPIRRVPEGLPSTATLRDVQARRINACGPELAAAVAAIAESPGPVLVHCGTGEERTDLVVALTGLAAGMAEAGGSDDAAVSATALRNALADLTHSGGVEPYLLRHGLTVDHFHSLRDRIAAELDDLAD